ncbi:WD repeat-containing protein [Entamoeba marina]
MFTESTKESQLRHQQTIKKLEEKWRIRKIALPTDDKLIMLRLRELKEPILRFGESFEDRRERLRECLATIGSDQGFPKCVSEKKKEEEMTKALHYTAGSSDLLSARRWVLVDSLLRAQARTKSLNQHLSERDPSYYEGLSVLASTIGDEYRVMKCCVHDSSVLTGGFDGTLRLWDCSGCSLSNEMPIGCAIYSVNFSPLYPSGPLAFAAGAADGAIRLFTPTKQTPLILKGHLDRVNAVEFHPSGRFLVSAAHDALLRIWDLESGAPLITQTGHAGAVRAAKWQGDGGVFSSVGEDKLLKLWDFRTGKLISNLKGHNGVIFDVDWNTNGRICATASEDNTVKVWDMRMQKCTITIPAHNKQVTTVKFNHSGRYLLSGSFDQYIKIWDLKDSDWKMVFQSHDHLKPVTSALWNHDDSAVISTSFDKTWKVWGYPHN